LQVISNEISIESQTMYTPVLHLKWCEKGKEFTPCLYGNMVNETSVIVRFGHSWGVTKQHNEVTRNRVMGKNCKIF